METKHTPGPWETDDKEIYGTDPATGLCNDLIAELRVETRPGGLMTGTDHANARLIAAAPDLLAALEKTTAWLYRIRGEDPSLVLDHTENGFGLEHARAAIARATDNQS